jgi:hypothetical protein
VTATIFQTPFLKFPLQKKIPLPGNGAASFQQMTLPLLMGFVTNFFIVRFRFNMVVPLKGSGDVELKVVY